MTPHDFDDEDAVMALRSGVEPVDSLGGDFTAVSKPKV